MRNFNKKFLDKFKLPNADTLVILNGLLQENLSAKCVYFATNKNTLNIPQNIGLDKPIHLLFLCT